MKKKNDTEALKPSGFFSGLPKSVNPAVKDDIVSIGDEERSLAALSNHSGWTVLKTFIDRQLDDLDEVTNAGMIQGLSLEDIGRNALVANLTKGIVKRIKQKVEDAREAVEKEDGLQ